MKYKGGVGSGLTSLLRMEQGIGRTPKARDRGATNLSSRRQGWREAMQRHLVSSSRLGEREMWEMERSLWRRWQAEETVRTAAGRLAEKVILHRGKGMEVGEWERNI